MKTYFLSSLLAIALLISYNDSMTQQLPPAKFKTLGSFTSQNRDDASDFFACPIESVYGQQPFTDMILGIPSIVFDTLDIAISLAMDNIPGFSGPITGLTFWGAFLDTAGACIPGDAVHFKLFLFQAINQNLEPAYQIDLHLSGEMIMVDTLPVFRYEVQFPAPVIVDEDMGISIVQWLSGQDMEEMEQANQFPCFFHWLVSLEGDQQSIVVQHSFDSEPEFFPLPVDLAFCLKKGVALPLSDYALFIAMTLILTLAVFRFRHYSR